MTDQISTPDESTPYSARAEPRAAVPQGPLLRIESVVKRFGKFTAVDKLSLDIWAGAAGRMDPKRHLSLTLDLASKYTPWVYERARDVELTDARATLHGRYTPTVRQPVAHRTPHGVVVRGNPDDGWTLIDWNGTPFG